MKNGWEAGAFSIATPGGDYLIAGWIKGRFALDFRVFVEPDCMEDVRHMGWALTHVPTGFIIRRLACDLPSAIDIADSIAALGDWDFTNPAGCKPYAALMAPLRKTWRDGVGASSFKEMGPTFRSLSSPYKANNK